LFKSHPDFNTTDKPWLESRNGKLWRKKKDSKGNEFTRLPHYEQLSGDPLTKEQVAKLPKRKCECAQLNALSEFSERKIQSIISCKMIYGQEFLEIKCLIDSGAIWSNYGSTKVIKWLEECGATKKYRGTYSLQFYRTEM
jgi:hypothetical protein